MCGHANVRERRFSASDLVLKGPRWPSCLTLPLGSSYRVPKGTQVLVLQLGGLAITGLEVWLQPDGLACLAPTGF